MQLFEFSDFETNQIFNKYIDYDGIVFRFKDGINLETMSSYKGEKFYPLKILLNSSKKLIKYLSQLDFSEIVLKKAENYGIHSLEQIDENIFSQKELEILHQLNFGQTNKKLELKKDCKNKISQSFLNKNELFKFNLINIWWSRRELNPCPRYFHIIIYKFR